MAYNESFSLDKPRYDLSTYTGRLQHFITMTNPAALLTSDSDLRNAEASIQRFRETGKMTTLKNDGTTATAAEMYHYQSLVASGIHPATGDIIPKLCRVSAIAPMNIPLVYAMLVTPASNVVGTLACHWANQTYNAACNYFNRSGVGQPMEAMGKAYGLAVGSACAIAYGMGRVVKASPALQRYAVWIPVLSTAAASSSNLAFTRADELTGGAEVVDEDGVVRGKSIVAGQQGVFQTALSRCAMVPFAVILLPDMLSKALEKMKMMPRSKGLAALTQCAIIYGCFQLALPGALAVFPQVICN